MESIRLQIVEILSQRRAKLPFTSTLWGWNFGFDFAPSGYRLHASHQQIHQQFARQCGQSLSYSAELAEIGQFEQALHVGPVELTTLDELFVILQVVIEYDPAAWL